jgi:AcrR family transcriptional regulator
VNAPVPRVRRDEVRRRLLDAAAEVFARRGYDAARLAEIAQAAGFTKGAVYSNFAGKHALLAQLIDRNARTQLAVGTVEVAAQGRPWSAAENIAEVFARGIVEQGTWSRLIIEIAQQAAHDPEVRQAYIGIRRALRDELAAAIADGCARHGIELTVPAGRLALTLQALRMGLALENGTDPDEVDQAAVTAVFTTALRSVIRRPTPVPRRRLTGPRPTRTTDEENR